MYPPEADCYLFKTRILNYPPKAGSCLSSIRLLIKIGNKKREQSHLETAPAGVDLDGYIKGLGGWW